MRFVTCLVVSAALLPLAAMAQVDPGPTKNLAARLTIDPPTTPAKGDNPPTLQSISYRTQVLLPNGQLIDLIPDFHFIAPNGNAVILRRELVDTNFHISQSDLNSAPINLPADAQKKGAVISGGWRCGAQVYWVTQRAYIMDADGNRSNSIQYTIHCNGG